MVKQPFLQRLDTSRRVFHEQMKVLQKLLRTAEETEFGRIHHFSKIRTYVQFRDMVALQSYDDLKRFIDEVINGASDILWPGQVKKFAVSAATTGKGKQLPVTKERLRADQRFMRKIMLQCIKQRSNPFALLGSQISIPSGSIERTNEKGEPIEFGEISAFLANETSRWYRYLQVVDPRELAETPFAEKEVICLRRGLSRDVRVIAGTPARVLNMFKKALQMSGQSSIANLWPRLKLVVCGGAKLENYRPALERICHPLVPDFLEAYGASEGFFAFSDIMGKRDLGLLLDNGIFYEWILDPVNSGKEGTGRSPVPTWDVQLDTPYAPVVTTNAGLWRYCMGDVVEFTSLKPPRILVKGRIEEMLDEFGEAVYASDAEAALKDACRTEQIMFHEFTIVSGFDEKKALPVHLWFVHFYAPVTKRLRAHLAREVDVALSKRSEYYAMRRNADSLDEPRIYSIDQRQIDHWFEKKGRLGAQAKLPRVTKDAEAIVHFLQEDGSGGEQEATD